MVSRCLVDSPPNRENDFLGSLRARSSSGRLGLLLLARDIALLFEHLAFDLGHAGAANFYLGQDFRGLGF